MNVLLDNLYARRPKIHYVCPPICGVQFVPTSSGSPSVSIEPVNPLACVQYRITEDGFLTWDEYPGAVCYNVYMTPFIEPPVPPVSPEVTGQPESEVLDEGETALFSVTASGTAPLAYQWQKNGVDIPGATSSSFSISNAVPSDSGDYRVIITNEAGTVVSDTVSLVVNPAIIAPTITVQPQSQTVEVGTATVLSVTATGTAPLTYQWKKAGVDIGGETGSTLTFASPALGDTGSYTVLVTNAAGSVLSDAAVLTVLSAGDYLAYTWSNQVVTNGGAAPSSGSKSAVSTFWTSLISAGIHTKMISVVVMAPDNLIAAITPITKTAGNTPWTNMGFLSGDLTVNGLISDGTKYLKSGVIPASDYAGDNSAGLTYYRPVSTAEQKIGCGTANFILAMDYISLVIFDCWNAVGGRLIGGMPAEAGFISGNRTNATSAAVYRASSIAAFSSVLSSTTQSSIGTRANAPLEIYAFSTNSGGVASDVVTTRHSFFAIHTGLSAAEAQAFYNAIQALRVAFGGGYA